MDSNEDKKSHFLDLVQKKNMSICSAAAKAGLSFEDAKKIQLKKGCKLTSFKTLVSEEEDC